MNAQIDLKINEAFRSLIPPLSDHELQCLEAEIRYWAGCYSPIITWNGTIIDGHHRYAICKKHGLSFKTEERQFEDEIAVKRWMIKNQFSRRNLPLHKRLDLAFIDEELEQQQAKQRQLSTLKQFQLADDECTTDRSPVTERQDQETGKTLECVAKKAECSYGTAFQYKKIKEAGLAERVVNGESIKKVYDDLRREKARAELKQSLESIEAQEAKSLAGVYDVIVIDPPWDIKKIERDVAPEQVDLDYPTMSLDEIKALDIPCAEDCHVFYGPRRSF